MLYFLYGHSLDICELGYPGDSIIETLGIATLKDYEFIFRSYPNIEPSKDKVVTGVLIHLDDVCKLKLNENELCPSLYTKRYIKVWWNGWIRAVGFTQKFTRQLPKNPPPPEYLTNLYNLYMQNGLPLDQINNAISEFKNCY